MSILKLGIAALARFPVVTPRPEPSGRIRRRKVSAMAENIIQNLYDTVIERRDNPSEGSYTGYLFEQGLDKILKKCGEECSEVIIAAKNGGGKELTLELSDLLYHLSVLMVERGVTPDDLAAELDRRHQKQGNLKKFHTVDTNS